MRTIAALLVVFATTPADADVPETYLGASLELSNGYDGASEVGFAAQVAPVRFLELEVGTIKHDVDGDESVGERSDTWLLSLAARGKLPLGDGALFAGAGMVTGEHSARDGCTSSGFLNFCGDRQGTFVYRHWEHAVWIRPEIGGEAALGPIAARISVSPIIQLASPDAERGCLECSDGQNGIVVTLGIHGRLRL